MELLPGGFCIETERPRKPDHEAREKKFFSFILFFPLLPHHIFKKKNFSSLPFSPCF